MVRGLGSLNLRKKSAAATETEMTSDISSISQRAAARAAAEAAAAAAASNSSSSSTPTSTLSNDIDGECDTASAASTPTNINATNIEADLGSAFDTIAITPKRELDGDSNESDVVGDDQQQQPPTTPASSTTTTPQAIDTLSGSNDSISSGNSSSGSIHPFHIVEGSDESGEVLITPIAVPPKTALQLRYAAIPTCQHQAIATSIQRVDAC
jgi:hypothetical protein